jgi:sugar-specific transcriptional regulator TrmB
MNDTASTAKDCLKDWRTDIRDGGYYEYHECDIVITNTNKRDDEDNYYYIEVEKKINILKRLKNAITRKNKKYFLKIKKVLNEPCDNKNKFKSQQNNKSLVTNKDVLLDCINSSCGTNINFSNIKETILIYLERRIKDALGDKYKLKYCNIIKTKHNLKGIQFFTYKIDGITYNNNGVLNIKGDKTTTSSSSSSSSSLSRRKTKSKRLIKTSILTAL